MNRLPMVLPVESDVVTWAVLPSADGISTEELLALRIRQLERRASDICKAVVEETRRVRDKTKEYVDSRRLRQSVSLRVGDWVLVRNSQNEIQH
ncbi:MAG: hypothetical protein BJ554DRAFT_7214 [Olpidium bornovanus]|uniref:Uncharacterized protein n=1 Tax=Olpidium bornovanus TaxID=278681 RepID=A0A8H7ZWU3_9FUNG|nr:MAG: hypothetical protein BJ554DRAFT_7214 [Olpidium bornovanus]